MSEKVNCYLTCTPGGMDATLSFDILPFTKSVEILADTNGEVYQHLIAKEAKPDKNGKIKPPSNLVLSGGNSIVLENGLEMKVTFLAMIHVKQFEVIQKDKLEKARQDAIDKMDPATRKLLGL